jgi:peptide/nickel transport system permease protein
MSMSFFIFLAKKVVGLIVLLVILITMVFFFSRALPGNIAAMYVGEGHAKAEVIEHARIQLGLDKPLYIQYFRYWDRLLHADLGISLRTHRPVLKDLKERIPMSFELVLLALVLASLFGISAGVIATIKQGTWLDEFIKMVASGCVSVPIFFIALLLQILFFNVLGWFPLQGRIDTVLEFTSPIEHITGFSLVDTLVTGNFSAFFSVLWHIVLPTVSLTAVPFGWITRLTRSVLLEVMQQDYILSGRASGISERVLFFRYGLRNALSPVLTVIGLTVAFLLIYTFFVEQIFNWPGIGYYTMNAIMSLDYPALLGVAMMIGTVYVIANTLTDIGRRMLDPRIK